MDDKELAREVGALIAARRKARGLTQAQVAEAINVEKETISRIETGAISPTLIRLKQLSQTLGCSLGDLLRHHSDKVEDQAATLAEMMGELSEAERTLLLGFVADVVKLFRGKPAAD